MRYSFCVLKEGEDNRQDKSRRLQIIPEQGGAEEREQGVCLSRSLESRQAGHLDRRHRGRQEEGVQKSSVREEVWGQTGRRAQQEVWELEAP
jgi:hypothetical protein